MKINLSLLKIFFIFCVGFFLPWGANFAEIGGYPPNYFIIATFVLALFLFSSGINIPYEFRLFFLLLFINIALTTLIFGRDYLFLERAAPRSIGQVAGYLISENNMRLIGKFLFLIVFFIVVASVIKKRKEWLVLAISFVAGLGVVCLLKLNVVLASFPEIRFAGAYDDPNAFGISACIAFFLSILLYDSVRKSHLKAVFIVTALFFLMTILLSQSRGAVLALISASFVMLIGKKLTGYRLVLMTIVSFLGVFCYFKQLIPLRLITSESWIDNRGAHRLDIWTIYLSNAWSFLLTGVGFMRGRDVISTGIIGIEYVPHNVFLEMFVEFGTLGLLLFCYTLRKLWLRLMHLPKGAPYTPALKALFICWIIGAFFIPSNTLRETWFVFALIVSAPALLERNQEFSHLELPKEMVN